MKEKSNFKKPKLPKHFIITGKSYGSKTFFLIYLHKKLTEKHQKINKIKRGKKHEKRN